MTDPTSTAAGSIGAAVKHWFHCRFEEATRCRECTSAVTPWTSHCPNCGQANPAQVSAAAGVYLALGFALLTIILSALVMAF